MCSWIKALSIRLDVPMQAPQEKGYSQGDWMQLSRGGTADLSGLGGAPPRRGITMEEVRRHNSKHDAWMVLHGKVRDDHLTEQWAMG